jgi:hypothetical protein
MVSRSDSLGPLQDLPQYQVKPKPVYTSPPRNRVPWPDGRVYRHVDGTLCDAGENEVGYMSVGTPLIDQHDELTCWLHYQPLVLAARFRHEEDPDGDCEATVQQVTRFPGEALMCTLHELPVEQVW